MALSSSASDFSPTRDHTTRNSRLTHGYAKLDPALRAKKLVTAWRPWVPEAWKAAAS